jgi:hypothetical protein
MRWASGVKYAGGALFAAGALMLAFAINGLLPNGTGAVYNSDAFSKFILDIGMLLVATFMVAIGIFFVVYGGQHKGVEQDGEEWTE